MDIRGSFKSLSTQMIKKRLFLHVHMTQMLIDECHLGYVMPLAYFNIAWRLSFQILLGT